MHKLYHIRMSYALLVTTKMNYHLNLLWYVTSTLSFSLKRQPRLCLRYGTNHVKSNARLKQLDLLDYFIIPKIYFMINLKKTICAQVICYICSCSFVVLSQIFKICCVWKNILCKILFKESVQQLSSIKFHFEEKEVHDIGAITTNFLKSTMFLLKFNTTWCHL